jgi:soluble lytic murein transglycosylase-like protein
MSAEVLRYEPLIRKYAKKTGLDYTGLIMALIQQESGGRHLDVMQSSESIGLPPGAITDPEYYSIMVGVEYFEKMLQQAEGDINLALQSYNFGGGFIPYALKRGGYTKEVVMEFSLIDGCPDRME